MLGNVFHYLTIIYIMIYCLFCIISLNAVVSIKNSRRQSINILFVSVLVCYILSFIRWETGTDWDSYFNIFQSSKNINNNYTNIEPFFFLLNHLFYNINTSYTFFLFFEATIIFTCCFFALKNQPYPLISLFLLFASTLGNIMFVRQSIAVALVVLSYNFILTHDKIKFYACIILATLFHTSAIVAFPIYIIFYSRIRWKYVIILIVIIALIGIYSSGQWLRFIASGNVFLEYKINSYLDASESGSDLAYVQLSPQKAIISHFMKRTILILLVILFCRGTIINRDIRLNGYLRIYIYSTCLYLLVTPLSLNLSRICTSIEIVDIFLYPYILSMIQKPFNKSFALCCIFLLGISKFISNVNRYPEIYNHYMTIFQ